MNKKLLLGAFVAVSTMLGVVGTTHADPPANTGWDENPDIVVGGGSDTTYLVAQRLEVLYNGAPGCAVNLLELTAKGDCVATAPGVQSGPINGNYDHDLAVSAVPTGSGSGVDALRVGAPTVTPGTFTQYTPPIDYARSSSGPSGTRLEELTYWGYARDAIAVLSFGSAHSGLCISQAQLQQVYTLAINNWNQLANCAGTPYASAPIIPWAMNGASGTNGVFNTFIAPTSTATNGRRLQPSNVAPFENDVKPLLADAGPDGTIGNADDDENNYLWWISGGDWDRYAFTKNGCVNGVGTYSPSGGTCTGGTTINSNEASVSLTGAAGTYFLPNATTINNNSYPILRTLFHVTRDIDADCRQTANTAGACDNVGDNVYSDAAAEAALQALPQPGYTVAKGGAVREFTRWLCRNTNPATNPVTGRTYRAEIVAAINAEGFQQTVANTAGYRCIVST